MNLDHDMTSACSTIRFCCSPGRNEEPPQPPEATQVAPALRVMSQGCQIPRAPMLRKFCQILLSDEMVRY